MAGGEGLDSRPWVFMGKQARGLRYSNSKGWAMGLSNKQRQRAVRRWRRVVAGALCAGSFLTGQLLFGEGLPQPLPRPGGASKLVPTAIRPAGEPAPIVSPSTVAQGVAAKATLAPIVSPDSLARPARREAEAARPSPVEKPVEKPAEKPAQLAPIVTASSLPRPRPAVPAALPAKEEASQSPASAGSASPSPWMKDIRSTLAEMNTAAEAEKEESPAPLASTPVPLRMELSPSQTPAALTHVNQTTQASPAVAKLPPLVVPARPEPTPVAPQPILNPTITSQVARSSPPAAPAPSKYQPAAPAKDIYQPEAPAKELPPVVSRPQVQAVQQVAAREEKQFTPRPVATLPTQRTFAASQVVPAAAQAAPAELEPAPLAGGVPAGSPFEVIEESGAVTLRVRRSKLMRTKVDIYRTAVVDEGICEVVQFTPREISLIGRSTGSTHITFWFDDPNMQPLTYLIKVEPDAEAVQAEEDKYKLLEDVINEMFPDSKIHLLIVADKLIVKGQAKDAEEAAQIMALITAQAGQRNGVGGGGAFGGASLAEGAAAPVLSNEATGNGNRTGYTVINMLRVPGVQQVALKVKIAELNRSAARGFGVDVRGAVDLTSSATGSKLFLNSMLNMAAGQGTSLMAQVDGDDIQLGIRYLQEHGVIRLLSEPTLVTMSGRPATFIAGGEFAVPTIVGSAGLNAVTTDFRAFGAIISFMPTVIDKDRIRLEVAPEFSQINNSLSVGGTPGLKVRAATTTVEMREGQTLAIAGLLEDNLNGTNVGDLPFLARVFGRRNMAHNETELIILVTPELVQPLDAEEVPPLPGFDVTEPNNGQFFLHGSLEGNPTQDYRSTVWPRLKKRYGSGGPAMTSGPFGHGQ